MDNLAGNADCDLYIIEELKRSKIEPVAWSGRLGEVPSRLHGRLGQYRLWRSWRYWSVTGPVPLNVANELYEDPVGRQDIRVAGHCACPTPQEWADWFLPDGRKVLPWREKAEFDRHMAKGGYLKQVLEPNLVHYEFSDDPASIGAQGYVTSYHIDSEVGLRLFCDTLRKYGLDKVTTKWWDESGDHA